MTCTLRVLGCSGGISQDLRTTSFLLNEHILIDAGTGVGDIAISALQKIDTVFLTHSHLDHICSLPLLLDAVGVQRSKPLRVYGIAPTINALQVHIFNNVIWPDFTQFPTPDQPCVIFEVIDIGQTISIDQVQITALPVNHSIPANGYWIDSGDGALVFSGDTGPSPQFWDAINQALSNCPANYLKHLIIENSFTNTEKELARLSGHYHPAKLAVDLSTLNSDCQIWITHLKPDAAPAIMQEIKQALGDANTAQSLQRHQILGF